MRLPAEKGKHWAALLAFTVGRHLTSITSILFTAQKWYGYYFIEDNVFLKKLSIPFLWCKKYLCHCWRKSAVREGIPLSFHRSPLEALIYIYSIGSLAKQDCLQGHFLFDYLVAHKLFLTTKKIMKQFLE